MKTIQESKIKIVYLAIN